MTENKRKNFDPANSFTFFGSWYYTAEDLEKVSIETSQRFYKAVCRYSMFDEEPNFEDNPFMQAMWRSIQVEIDNSIKRRKRYFDKDTISEDHEKIIDAIVKYPNCSLREIADKTGTSKDMVARVKRKYSKEIAEKQSKKNDNCNGGLTKMNNVINEICNCISGNVSDSYTGNSRDSVVDKDSCIDDDSFSYTDIDYGTDSYTDNDTMRHDSATDYDMPF